MSVGQYRQAVCALRDFPTHSPPSITVKHKCVGMIGGEPMIHPDFEELVKIAVETIPVRENRGLWTGLSWHTTQYASLIRESFGYVNNNRHDSECLHSPILVATKDVIPDRQEMWRAISRCWLQEKWSGTITAKGLFFCEVAGMLDMLFGGPGGLPVEPGCWRRPLTDFDQQIKRWCPMCGIPLNLVGRRDRDGIDDVSESNLLLLRRLRSPRVEAGRFERYQGDRPEDPHPWNYLR